MTKANESERTNEGILFSDLRPNDAVVMETENSVYRFVITDVDRRMGSLKGGRMDVPREAIAGGIVEGENNVEFFSDGLRRGGRAVFFMLTPKASVGFDRVLTSGIERVYVDRSSSDRRAA
jgi:hypothetical protein